MSASKVREWIGWLCLMLCLDGIYYELSIMTEHTAYQIGWAWGYMTGAVMTDYLEFMLVGAICIATYKTGQLVLGLAVDQKEEGR